MLPSLKTYQIAGEMCPITAQRFAIACQNLVLVALNVTTLEGENNFVCYLPNKDHFGQRLKFLVHSVYDSVTDFQVGFWFVC